MLTKNEAVLLEEVWEDLEKYLDLYFSNNETDPVTLANVEIGSDIVEVDRFSVTIELTFYNKVEKTGYKVELTYGQGYRSLETEAYEITGITRYTK